MSKLTQAKSLPEAFQSKIAECGDILLRDLRKPNSVEEHLWAAGFFDGEGHVSASDRPGQFECAIDQIEDDLVNLVRFLNAVGVGRISPLNRQKRGNSRPLCRWQITNQNDLKTVFAKLGQYLNPAKRNGRPVQLKDKASPPSDGFARALAVPFYKIISRDLEMTEGSFVQEVGGKAEEPEA